MNKLHIFIAFFEVSQLLWKWGCSKPADGGKFLCGFSWWSHSGLCKMMPGPNRWESVVYRNRQFYGLSCVGSGELQHLCKWARMALSQHPNLTWPIFKCPTLFNKSASAVSRYLFRKEVFSWFNLWLNSAVGAGVQLTQSKNIYWLITDKD